MKAVIQRVTSASVKVDGKVTGEIGPGLMVLFGAGHGDTEEEADYMVRKISRMRIFSDSEGKMNKSVKDIDGEILAVSQFTLYADCRRGNRPSFTDAEDPEHADQLYEYFCGKLEEETGKETQKGIFGADMQVSLVNDGPVTIVLQKEHEIVK